VYLAASQTNGEQETFVISSEVEKSLTVSTETGGDIRNKEMRFFDFAQHDR